MTPDVIRELMNRLANKKIKPQWWGGWGSGGPTGGGTDDTTGGKGPAEAGHRGVGLFGPGGLYDPSPGASFTPHMMASVATPYLRRAGFGVGDANSLIRAARMGTLQFTPNGFFNRYDPKHLFNYGSNIDERLLEVQANAKQRRNLQTLKKRSR